MAKTRRNKQQRRLKRRRTQRRLRRRQRGGVINDPTTETFEGIPFIPGARTVIATPEGTMSEKEYRERSQDPYLTR
jgi:hypothetical protein